MTAAEQLLKQVIQRAISETSRIPGDIPSILSRAYHLEHHKQCLIQHAGHIKPVDTPNIEELLDMLRSITLENEVAFAHVALAIGMLTVPGPELSMNIPLSGTQNLPARLYTLLQGTVWALMLEAGADPDLDNREDVRVNRCNKRYTAQDKCLWFLCRKTFFSMHVADKDGEYCRAAVHLSMVHFRRYAGRLYARGDNKNRMTGVISIEGVIPRYQWVRVPPSSSSTPNELYNLGLGHNHPVYPTRLGFDAPRVAEGEASLLPQQKHRLIQSIFLTATETMLVTAWGTVVAGDNSHGRLGMGTDTALQVRLFTEVTLPPRFTPEELVSCPDYTAVRCRDLTLLAGRNHHGQLGLGQATDDIVNYTQAPFPAVRAWCMSDFTVFLSGDRLLYAGKVGMLGGRFLHGLTECPAAVPLNLPWAIKGVAISQFVWAFIREDGTTCGTWASGGTLVRWELLAVMADMRTQYDCCWVKAGVRWFGLGMNWDEELGVHGPTTVVGAPTPVEWVTPEFLGATTIEIVGVAE
ncbi:hypothetical protein J8273_8266 [Carpediemonas membranifera]|uniref:Uncharacterized protein n=1 Tax=Carpediemonas membranifera TaxID=201153 RepID=A0A8J6APQ0_9EUKA|nr:hypothetical protein J8273_8266 [Carpediemonas membranifera]|eukprot:KAG9390226.1 hypothetical protein J8273_8266 [Carpediemonas membranifera]